MTAPPLRRHEEMGRRQSVDRQDARCALFPCRVGGEQSRGPRGRTAYRRRSDPGRPLSRQHTGSDTGKELPEEPSLRGGPTPHCVLRNAHCAPPDQKSHARSDDRHGPPADAARRTDLGIPRSRAAVEAHPRLRVVMVIDVSGPGQHPVGELRRKGELRLAHHAVRAEEGPRAVVLVKHPDHDRSRHQRGPSKIVFGMGQLSPNSQTTPGSMTPSPPIGQALRPVFREERYPRPSMTAPLECGHRHYPAQASLSHILGVRGRNLDLRKDADRAS